MYIRRKAAGAMRRTLRMLGRLAFAVERLNRPLANESNARIGVFVPYYKARWVFEKHLQAFRYLTSGPVNYYVMANCGTFDELQWCNSITGASGFARTFHPWPKLLPLSHGESIQRMVDRTAEEIILLCDVDAYPIIKGWDEFILRRMENREVAAAIVDMPARSLTPFLHPCVLAVRREFMQRNRLSFLAGEGNDPAYQITQHLLRVGAMNDAHVAPLFPTKREIVLAAPGANALLGRDDLIHGFGTTYADAFFHFWFARYIGENGLIGEKGVEVEKCEIDAVVSRAFGELDRVCFGDTR